MKKLGFLVFFVVFIGCKKKEIEREEPGAAESSVTYQEKVQVVEKAPMDVIVSVNETTQQYTLKKEAFQSPPKTGEIILIPGELMRKVKSVSSSGNNYVISTEDAAVTEVIKNGTIAFDISPEWGDASSMRIAGQEVLEKGQRISISPIEHQVSVGGVEHKIVITPQRVNGKINSCTFEFHMSKGNSTAFVASGTATLPNQKAHFEVENGKLKDFSTNNKGIKASFSVRMATAGGKTGEHSIKLPEVALSIPIRFIPGPAGPIPNPIPMSIDVGVQFVSMMTIRDPRSSATGESKVTFDADAGFQYVGSDISTSGKLNQSDMTDGKFDSAANLGNPVDLQFGVAFPRVSLKIAGQEVTYVHVGYSTGSRLNWGPLCKSGYSKVVVEGGYELKVFGQTLSSAQKTFAEVSKKAGDNCD